MERSNAYNRSYDGFEHVNAFIIRLNKIEIYEKARINKRKNRYSPLVQILLFSASLISGFIASFFSLPFDNAKTKMQKMRINKDGVFPYKNIFDAILKTIRNEGFSHLWVGFPTFYFRIAPHVFITLITQDFLTDFISKFRGK